jgi:hypothetical protein
VKKQQQPKNTPLFDDALPEQLLAVAAKQEDAPVRLRVDEPIAPSPFVVRLTRADETVKPLRDPIAELAQSLVFDDEEEVGDEAPLVTMEEDHETLRERPKMSFCRHPTFI